MGSVLVREYESGDESGIISLLSSEWGRRSLDEWRWMYRWVPNGSIVVVAETAGRIVGHVGMLLLPMTVLGEEVLGSLAVDLVVAPSLRRGGVSLRMWSLLMEKAREAGVRVSYSFAAKGKGSLRGALRSGWFEVGGVSEMVYLASERLLSRRIGLPLPSVLGWAVRRLFDLRRAKVGLGGGGASVRITAVPSDWRNVTPTGGPGLCDVQVVRDSVFVSWRYERPGAVYRLVRVERRGQDLGSVVVRLVEEGGLSVVYVMDIFPRFRLSGELFGPALSLLVASGADAVVGWCGRESAHERLYRRCGFVENPFRRVALIASPAMRRLRGGRWCPTLGDVDNL